MWKMLAPAVFVSDSAIQAGVNGGLYIAHRWTHQRMVSVAPYWLWETAKAWGFAVVDDFGSLVNVATFEG